MPKKEKIQEMFDRIAPSYDRLNHLMSLNVDKRWRRRALREIVDGTPQRILDVACGTGDSTIAIARAAADGSRVTGVDISEGMMDIGRKKVKAQGLDEIISFAKILWIVIEYASREKIQGSTPEASFPMEFIHHGKDVVRFSLSGEFG